MFKKKYKIKLKDSFKTLSWYKYEIADNLICTKNRRKANGFNNLYEARFIATYIEHNYNYKTEIV